MPVAFDLHIHTSRYSIDGRMNPFALVRRAMELKLDGVVITEHDWLWSEEELDELRAVSQSVQVYSGMEVSSDEGHMLVYGVTDASKLPAGIRLKDLCEEVHRQGGAVVAAHPFRFGQPFDVILEEINPALDGLELISGNMDEECRERAALVRELKGWTGLGSSDAHAVQVLGCCYTEFDDNIRDQRDLVEAIRSGKARALERKKDSHT